MLEAQRPEHFQEYSTNFLDPTFPIERTMAFMMAVPYAARGTVASFIVKSGNHASGQSVSSEEEVQY